MMMNQSSYNNSYNSYGASNTTSKDTSAAAGIIGLASTLTFGNADFRTVAARAHAVRLLGLLCSLYRFDMAPHLTRMQNYVLRRFRESEREIQEACATTFGQFVQYVLPADEPLAGILKPLFALLSEKSKDAQTTAAMSLAKVLESSIKASAATGNDRVLTESQRLAALLLKQYLNPMCMARPAMMDAFAMLVRACGPCAQSAQLLYSSGWWPAIKEAVRDPKDWFHRRSAVQVLAAVVALATCGADGVQVAPEFVTQATEHKSEIASLLDAARYDKIKPVRDTALPALDQLSGIPDPIIRANAWAAASATADDAAADATLARSLNRSMVRTIKSSPAKRSFKSSAGPGVALGSRSLNFSASAMDYSGSVDGFGQQDQADQEEDADGNAFEAGSQHSSVAASSGGAGNAKLGAELEKIARQQETLMQMLESFSVSTRMAFKQFEERLGKLEDQMERVTTSGANTNTHSPRNASAGGTSTMDSRNMSRTSSSSYMDTETGGGAWRKASGLWQQGQHNEAYRVLLADGDSMQLVRMMGRTGPVLDLLEDDVRIMLVDRWIEFLQQHSFLDNVLVWIEQAQEDFAAARVPHSTMQQLMRALHEVSAMATPHGIRAAKLYADIARTLQ
jgi:hypothetical protein